MLSVIKFEWKNVKNGMKGTFRGLTSRIMFTTKNRNTFARAFNEHVFPMTREIHLIGMALGVIAFTNPQRDHFEKERDTRLFVINENTILDDEEQLSQIGALHAAVKWIKDHGHPKYVVRSSTDETVEEISAEDGKAITETIDNSSGSGDDKEENAKKPVKISAKQIGKLLKALKKINDSDCKTYLKKLGCTTTISTSKQSTSNASDQTKKAQESSIDSIIRSATKKGDKETIKNVLNYQIKRGTSGYCQFEPYEFHKDEPRRVHVYTIPSLLDDQSPIIGELLDIFWATKNSPGDLIEFDRSFITRSQGRDILLKLYKSIKNKSYKTSTNPPTYHNVFVLAYDDGADNRWFLERWRKPRDQMGTCVAFTTVEGLDKSTTYHEGSFDYRFERLQKRLQNRIANILQIF